jgi:radical SAM protein with 4Fe4S-binding SPASM domain
MTVHWFGWKDIAEVPSVEGPLTIKPARSGRFLDLMIGLDLPWDQTGLYEYLAVQFCYGSDETVPGCEVVTYRMHRMRTVDTVRLLVPDSVYAATHVRIGVAPAMHCRVGRHNVVSMGLTDDEEPAELSRIARLEALKERVRQQVEGSEQQNVGTCGHYPSTLTFEMTARCNLTCSHCSSHGKRELHLHYNRTPEFPLDRLEAFAEEVFPSLTSISIVGRGEPMLLSDALWNRFIELLVKYRVMLSVTTNGYFLERRLTPELMPFIDNINVSMDGLSKETFALNRGGGDVDRVWHNIEFFHHLRKSSGLARRPRLHFAWTLKQSNVEEFPAFVHKIAQYEADALTARHLMVFFESEAEQSVLLDPARANIFLREGYRLLEQYGIRRECVPLIAETSAERLVSVQTVPLDEPPVAETVPTVTPGAGRDSCMFIHRMAVVNYTGEVQTCSVPYSAVTGTVGETSFFNIWNGSVMQGVREALGTDHEWKQCQNCWYREGRYHSQRALAADGRRIDNDSQTEFSKESLNFVPGRN